MTQSHRQPLYQALGVLLGLGLFGVQPALADGMPGGTATSPSPTAAEGEASEADDEAYTRAMEIGYAAAEAGDFHTALINFRRALAARPGDRYAEAAIENMEAYIEQARRAEARRQRIVELQALIQEAVSFQDWACAAASLDELISLLPPDAPDRPRLVTYRGEIAGLIDARNGVNAWSSVCSG